MRKNSPDLRFGSWITYAALILVSAAAYLPFIFKLGYHFDDWYLMFAAGARGAGVFRDIFSVDRPARALVMMLIYSMFGGNPLYYNLSAYILRVLGAFGFLSILRSLWPRERGIAFIMALLFLVYPGFLSQPNAIDYQSHLSALAAAMWSVALTLNAVNSTSTPKKVSHLSFSILLGFFYLSQIEWYIGFEAIRWACVLVVHMRGHGTLKEKLAHAIGRAYPVLIIPLFFLLWRLVFFKSQRGATDVSLQLGGLFTAPIATMGLWIISLAKDIVSVLAMAWVVPLSMFAFSMDTRRTFIATGLGILAVLFTVFGLKQEEKVEVEEQPQGSDWKREAMWLGSAALVFGLIPVVLANREVSFPSYSRYTLVGSVGAVIMIAAGLYQLASSKLRITTTSILVMFSILTHYGNGLLHANWAEEYRDFWWQVSWRVPQFGKNTTLVVNIPGFPTEEDYFVWGPVNLIYYPESQNDKVVQPTLYAAVLNQNTVQKVLARERQEYDNRRGIITYKNYRNVLVLSQPSPSSCVHLINGTQPEYSAAESDSIRVIGSFSELEHVLSDETPHTPPKLIFGSEPEHGWCYFYESADLARQHQEWELVVELGGQALDRGLEPKDLIEWMPFIEAYALTGEVKRLNDLAPLISVEPYVALQVCQALGQNQGLSQDVIEVVDSLYCLE